MKQLILALGLAVLAGACKSSKPEPVRVAAAADLQLAFTELGRTFTQRTGLEVSFNFGSTGLLATQLAEGAPFDLFAAANSAAIDDAVKAGACDGATAAAYATGALLLYSPREPLNSLEDLREPRFKRIGLAQPEHAPYGLAARQALERTALWDGVAARVVYAQNIAQTLQYAQTGNVEAAFISRSLRGSLDGGQVIELSPSLHDPLTQRLAVCVNGKRHAEGAQFAALVRSVEGQAVLARYGLLPPP